MKFFVVLVTVAAIALAEPPPPNSYLPPSPTSRNGGYPQGAPGGASGGAPQIIAARTAPNVNERTHGNGFARNGAAHDHIHARFNQGAQGYDQNSAALSRNAIDINAEPANYNFEYMVNDFNEGTDFGHHEERLEERAQGQYHVVLPDGRKQTVSYEADERGFKPKISYEDTEELTRSIGYDANARNGFNPGQDARTGY